MSAPTSFWVSGLFVRWHEFEGEWQALEGVDWRAASDPERRSISEHLSEHCAADGWPSHEADRALPHETFLSRLTGADPP